MALVVGKACHVASKVVDHRLSWDKIWTIISISDSDLKKKLPPNPCASCPQWPMRGDPKYLFFSSYLI